MKTVIMAGGKGTRISSISRDIPKPMIAVEGKPVLHRQIEVLHEQGYDDILLVIGHLGHVIRDYFGDGSGLGVHISYFSEDEPLGTAGALTRLRDVLTEDFWLINGDILFDVDLHRVQRLHQERGAWATLVTHPNNHPWDSALLVTDSEGRVTRWLNKEDPREDYQNRVNAGIHLLSVKLLAGLPAGVKLDLDRDILQPAVAGGGIFACSTPEYVCDMGTPERYRAVCEDVRTGRIHACSLRVPQRALLLDRDGTINVYDGIISDPDKIKLLPGAARAIAAINESPYLAIVITNQPGVARGDSTLEELRAIHDRLERLLGEQGAYLDGLYFCPHHPDAGFPGERPEYKVVCDCRKPRPGLILRAAQDFNLDLAQCWMVGDDLRDALAGHAAGCHTALLADASPKGLPADTKLFKDLSCFTRWVLGPEGQMRTE